MRYLREVLGSVSAGVDSILLLAGWGDRGMVANVLNVVVGIPVQREPLERYGF